MKPYTDKELERLQKSRAGVSQAYRKPSVGGLRQALDFLGTPLRAAYNATVARPRKYDQAMASLMKKSSNQDVNGLISRSKAFARGQSSGGR